MEHQKYLEDMVYSKKMELREIETKRRVDMAVYECKIEMIRKQIDSMEDQIATYKKDSEKILVHPYIKD